MSVQKRSYLTIAVLFFGAATLQAHDIPIYPVDVDLRVYPGVVRVRIDTNKCYWFAEVLHLEVPPPEWTDAQKGKIKEYVDDHFQLSVDGKRLDSHLEYIRYVQGFWQPYSLEARLLFTVSYAVPGPRGKSLKGHAAFFQEDWAVEEKEAKAEHRALDSRAYETHLHVHGRTPVSLTLTMEKPDFEFPMAAIRRSSWQARTDALWDFTKRNLSGAILVLAIAVVIYRYRDHFY